MKDPGANVTFVVVDALSIIKVPIVEAELGPSDKPTEKVYEPAPKLPGTFNINSVCGNGVEPDSENIVVEKLPVTPLGRPETL